MNMDLFSLVRMYILLLCFFFYYMYTMDKMWFSNKLIFYAATVYVPFFMFALTLLLTRR